MLKNYIIALLCLIILVLGYLYFKNNNNYSSPVLTNDLPTLGVKTIDNEHQDIVNAIDQLHNVCVKHWKTEDKYFDMGLSKLPPDHKDITSDIKQQTEQHKNFIDRIEHMKMEIVNHINDYDKPHFHWLKE